LGDILAYMEKLNELDTSNVEPMMHALPMTNVFREDEVQPSLDREAALMNAPKTDGEYFLVPRILDTE
jgi:aspartyl-tRNA(Asn)/glutamyl-tRNA(Gln) amidotransferase subunit C